MTSVAIITTCKGRLGFLRQTLPAMVATGFPVTVVDYDCPEGTGDFVAANFPGVNLVRVKDRPLFNHSEARNIGAANSSSKLLAFIDADVLLKSTFSKFVETIDFAGGQFFIGDGAFDDTVVGACIVQRRHFERINGYDEVIVGWGYEDIDLYVRLRVGGLERRFFPHDALTPIKHGDDLRVVFTTQKDPGESYRLNHIYSRIKIDLEGLTRRQLSVAERQQIRALAKEAIEFLIKRPTGAVVPLSIPISEETVSGGNTPVHFARALTYNLRLVQ